MSGHSHHSSSHENDESDVESLPHGDYVETMRVVHMRDGNLRLLVKNEIGLKFYIYDLSMIPSYCAAFQDEVMLSQYQMDTHNDDFERVFGLLKRKKIKLAGPYTNGNRLLNISDPEFHLPCSQGLLYYNSSHDKSVFGRFTCYLVPHCSMPILQVHIEDRQVDRRGRVTNNLTLRKETTYLVK